MGLKNIAVREALRDAMAEEMRRDPNVFLMGEEVAEYNGSYKVSMGLLDEFGPKRVIDTPITEMGFAGIGVGAAYAGLRPIVEFMSFNFAMQAIDQIINSASKVLYMSGGDIKCPIVFRGANGPSMRLAAQHSQCYASWYGHCPGMKVVAPFFADDMKGLLKASIRDENPVVFLENELLYGMKFDVPEDDDYLVEIGKARVVRQGKDVTLVSFSYGMKYLMDAKDALTDAGIDPEIIDLRTIRPLDIDTILESLKKTNRLVIVEQGLPFAGIASEIAMQVMEKGFDLLDAPVLRVTAEDVHVPYAERLEQISIPNTQKILAAVRNVMGK